MSWTDERVETLRRMWLEGQSASQIAKELGGVTRNAVIGKVHRLGLSNRGGDGVPAAPGGTPSPIAAAGHELEMIAADPGPEVVLADPPAADPDPLDEVRAPVPAPPARRPIITAGQPLPPQPSLSEISPEALASVREVEKRALRLSLMQLTERTCKWPVGDPATDEFWFCGLPSQAGKPYCEAHVGVAFQPMSARRDRRR
jgi:GcrA cell cycle regulator